MQNDTAMHPYPSPSERASLPKYHLPVALTPLVGREQGSQPLLDTLKGYLRNKELLLLLDNFEQVVSAAPVVAELLAAAPRLHVLVTSRTLLHLSGEHVCVVPPLSLPDLQDLPPLDRLTHFEAVQLFIVRAHAVQSDFAISAENAAAIVAICHQLDGLPLAIELAAGRSKLFSPQGLLPRLRNRLKLLIGGRKISPCASKTSVTPSTGATTCWTRSKRHCSGGLRYLLGAALSRQLRPSVVSMETWRSIC